MYTNNRDAFRQAFFTAWQKYQKKSPLEAVESQLIEIILLHPEYHPLLNKPASFQSQEFALEENPFFHMSLHVAVCEQVRMDRPKGIKNIHQQLMTQYMDAHDVEHFMMECLGRMLWKAQETGETPSEEEYLKMLAQQHKE